MLMALVMLMALYDPAVGWFCTAQAKPLLERLPSDDRLRVLMALTGLALLGIALMAFAWLYGRRVRRLTRQRPQRRQRGPSDWDRKQPAEEPSDGPPTDPLPP
jgi:hypothetical protein